MTDAQERAIREIDRLCQSAPNDFEITSGPELNAGGIVANVLIRIGPIETRDGGLVLREREEFTLVVPAGFPFDRPRLLVSHRRFAGFPHVIWGKAICLYQSSQEWNPGDGLYGFFDRLNLWLSKAAINDMDPFEGPLEPPHHVTAFSQKPFVIRANAPSPPGTLWTGVALLEDYPNRTELIGWNDLSGTWPDAGRLAFAAMLVKPIASEFPEIGADLFAEFEKVGLERDLFVRNAALAALFAPEGQPVHFVLGFPMRRGTDGSPRIHIAVWTTSAERAGYLRSSLPENTDSEKLKELREDLRDAIVKVLEVSTISWCQILEDRPEIISRRDMGTSMTWFARKKVLIAGCGALGSWAAEIAARAGATEITLVDNNIVKPGVLARQNFMLDDIGTNKAKALARRICAIAPCCSVHEQSQEAHRFLTDKLDHLMTFDLILDCTASSVFQMKVERDWDLFRDRVPPIVSIVIDGTASHCISVVISNGTFGGIWSGYLSLKKHLCTEGSHATLIQAFYADHSTHRPFLPEPGCSDPTFVGSTADVMALLATTLNLAVEQSARGISAGIALTSPKSAEHSCSLEIIRPTQFVEARAGKYRILMAANIFKQARGWVQQNTRLRGANCETGGLLWGIWDDAINAIWIFDVSGPPPDSQHTPADFVCGTKGTIADHDRRMKKTFGANGFVGHWHTHPNVPSQQSSTDMINMATLVGTLGGNQRRSLMLIFGRTQGTPTAGLYVYESLSSINKGDLISVGESQIVLASAVV